MKQGKTVGSYFVFLIKEGLFRLRKELFSWRGLIVLLFFGYMVLDTCTVKGTERLTSMGVSALWLVLLFPPRLGKLLYLLPFSKEGRKRYLATYAVTYFGGLVAAFLLLGALASLIAGYPYHIWVQTFVFSTIPFLALYSVVFLFGVVCRNSSVAWWVTGNRQIWSQPVDYVGGVKEDCKSAKTGEKKKLKDMTPKERKAKKKDMLFGVVTVVGSIVTVVHCYGFLYLGIFGIYENFVYVIGTVVAYVCSGITIGFYILRIVEELNSTGSTGKEECGCNS